MSVLNYTAPSVSGTNHVYNIVAIPSGVYRYIKEGRMAWPLTWVVIAGTLPGVFIGYYLRVLYLPDAKVFKLFVGCVLLYMGVRIFKELLSGKKGQSSSAKAFEEKFKAKAEDLRKKQGEKIASGLPADAVLRTISASLSKVEYEFWGERFSFNTMGMLALAFVVGIIGGAYGIGGGAIIAPFCVAFFICPFTPSRVQPLWAPSSRPLRARSSLRSFRQPTASPPCPTGLWGSCSGSAGSSGCTWAPRRRSTCRRNISRSSSAWRSCPWRSDISCSIFRMWPDGTVQPGEERVSSVLRFLA